MQKEFYDQLDQLYAENPQGVEGYLLDALARFQREADGDGLIAVYNELGSLYRGQTRYEASIQAFQQALDGMEERGLAGATPYLTALLNRAGTYRLAGRGEEAVEDFRSVLALLDGQTGDGAYIRASALNNLGLTYEGLGRMDAAEDCALRALELIGRLPGMEAETASSQNNLAAMCLRRDRLEEAERWIGQAMAYYQGPAGERDPHLANGYSTLAALRCRQGRLEEALEAYDRAAAAMERFFGRNLNCAAALYGGAVAARGLGRADSRSRMEEAAALYEALQGPGGEMAEKARRLLADWTRGGEPG